MACATSQFVPHVSCSCSVRASRRCSPGCSTHLAGLALSVLLPCSTLRTAASSTQLRSNTREAEVGGAQARQFSDLGKTWLKKVESAAQHLGSRFQSPLWGRKEHWPQSAYYNTHTHAHTHSLHVPEAFHGFRAPL